MIMEKNNYVNDISIKCGKVSDSFETLEKLCNAEADRLSKTIEIPDNTTVRVPFWTKDFPELICIGYFKKDENGNVSYQLDDSESTL